MKTFDRFSDDLAVRRLQSAIFSHTHAADSRLDQAYVDHLAHQLRSAYLAAALRAARGGLQHFIQGRFARSNGKCRDGDTFRRPCAGPC